MKSNLFLHGNAADWIPCCSLEGIQQRAQTLSSIRQFFADRNVLEVETPILSLFPNLDPHQEPFTFLNSDQPRYLQSSPEHHMKRLLAAGCPSIYQITRAFRVGDYGTTHNPEFTLLEWYRVNSTHYALAEEVIELIQRCAGPYSIQQTTYGEIFESHLHINPHTVSDALLQEAVFARDSKLHLNDRSSCLDYLWSHAIQPKFSANTLVLVHDFPVCQAALARIEKHNAIEISNRFEIFVGSLELANGYYELQNVEEHHARFSQAASTFSSKRPIDARFLEALQHGLPDCAGVALGVDRLILLALQQKKLAAKRLADVLTFDWDRA
ncbi:MAG: EF-P lysine aminoacylase EpmA [Pseudomonadota bacterium]